MRAAMASQELDALLVYGQPGRHGSAVHYLTDYPVSNRAHLIFLALPAADLAVARVAARVRQGGHDVPEAIVRRRFVAGLRNFVEVYRTIVDGWHMYDNSTVTGPRLIAHGAAGAPTTIADQAAWRRLEELR